VCVCVCVCVFGRCKPQVQPRGFYSSGTTSDKIHQNQDSKGNLRRACAKECKSIKRRSEHSEV
jgi:hypothetical protein